MPQRRSHFPIPVSQSSPASKRALSPRPSSSNVTPARQSKRLKSSPITKTTPKKSPYFEHPTSEESEVDSELEREESGYEDDDASAVSSPPSSDAESEAESEEYNSEDDERPKRGKKNRARKIMTTTKHNVAKTTNSTGQKGSELWRPGVKSTLAPGEAVFIKLPKARSAGSTPYTPTSIHPNTLLFLSDLRANNDREWLKLHDADYRASQADWNSFVESLTERIIEKDDTIPELPPKDLTFRIYRDIRFSPDPTPYKTHFSAAWSRTGRKGPYAGYYVQIQPKGSFVGAGVWHPEAPPLALLRQAVDRKSHKLKEILMADGMRRDFLGVAKADEKKCVAKFVDLNQESALKTKPKVCTLQLANVCKEEHASKEYLTDFKPCPCLIQGYEADNPNIALLRLRNYTIGKKLKDEEVLGAGALNRVSELIGVLTPFVSFPHSTLPPWVCSEWAGLILMMWWCR